MLGSLVNLQLVIEKEALDIRVLFGDNKDYGHYF